MTARRRKKTADAGRRRDLADAQKFLTAWLAPMAPGTAAGYADDMARLAGYLEAARAFEAGTGPDPLKHKARRGDPATAVSELFGLAAPDAAEMLRMFSGYARHWFAPSTINRQASAINSMYAYANVTGRLQYHLNGHRVRARLARDTSGPGRRGYLAMLKAAAETGGRKGLRDVAILHLLYDRALRRGEVAALDLADAHIQPADYRLDVMEKGTKGQGKTPLALAAETGEALAEWIALRGPAAGAMFINLDHAHASARLSAAGIYAMVTGYAKALGIRATPHGLRHSAITDAAPHCTLGDLQKFARHRDVRTLVHYYDAAADAAGQITAMLAHGTRKTDLLR